MDELTSLQHLGWPAAIVAVALLALLVLRRVWKQRDRDEERDRKRRAAYDRELAAYREALRKGDAQLAAMYRERVDRLRAKGWHNLAFAAVLIASQCACGCAHGSAECNGVGGTAYAVAVGCAVAALAVRAASRRFLGRCGLALALAGLSLLAGCRTRTVAKPLPLGVYATVVEPGGVVPPLPDGEVRWWLMSAPTGVGLMMPADSPLNSAE